MGVWIETTRLHNGSKQLLVTPCMGVWIETLGYTTRQYFDMSHPVWVCGLKHI